jgi:hypothetical protein
LKAGTEVIASLLSDCNSASVDYITASVMLMAGKLLVDVGETAALISNALGRLILFEAKLPQPTSDIHGGAPVRFAPHDSPAATACLG